MTTFTIPTLVTERLLLRAFRKTDMDDYAALNADPEVLRFRGTGTEPWDPGRVWRHMAFLLGSWPLGDAGMWALEHRETGGFVGIAGFAEPAGWPGFELAGALACRFWGQGYATEGGRAALAHAFDVLKKDRVISIIHPENRASIRAAERIGERLLGRIQHLGQEMLCYGLDRETWLRDASQPPDDRHQRNDQHEDQ
ncbi:MAG TPA: GNAT family N-acetyltransferase [Thermoanaerobaculia bacterium]|jgi:RimJ/RimL family protein N-acetyltransferase|nr:GNAT family N-acetyltransferase [Thermoanaerobaculia bacterium]